MIQLPQQMTISLGDDETPTSHCSRNAMLVGRNARDFCLDAGFAFQGVVDGNRDALEALAHRCRADAGLLTTTATVRFEERRYMIRDQVLTRDRLSRKMLRACPHCLSSDLDTGRGPYQTRPYGRLNWLIEPIRTCREHGVGLVPVSDDEHPQRLHDFALLVQSSLPNLTHLTRSASRREYSPFEDYLTRRLNNMEARQAPWLSTMPFYAAAKVCEMLGAVAIQGIRFTANALSDANWHQAGAVGYEIAQSGEPAIRAFLIRLQEAAPPPSGAWGPRAFYGRLYEWLANETEDKAYDPLREIIQRQFVETLPVGPGDEIFGQPVTVRRLHSVRSASFETGAHPKRLRKLLHAAGYIGTEALSLKDDAIVFEASEAGEFLDRVADAMSLNQARAYLNIPRPQERHLFEAGYLRPFIMGGTEILKDHAFAKHDLDAFLERLRGDATPLEPEDSDFQPIPATAQKASCPAVKVVELILNQSLARVRLHPDVPGYLSVMVDPEEVKSLLYEQRAGSLSLREVEQRLGSTRRVVKALIEFGHLPARITVNPVARIKQRVVSVEELDSFTKRFVTLHGLAKEQGIHFRKLADKFREKGIEPAFHPEAVHATFYERVTVADSVAQIIE